MTNEFFGIITRNNNNNIKIKNEEGGYSFCATVTLSSESGYYSGAYEFLNNGGIQATFTNYNESDSDSYDEDDY